MEASKLLPSLSLSQNPPSTIEFNRLTSRNVPTDWLAGPVRLALPCLALANRVSIHIATDCALAPCVCHNYKRKRRARICAYAWRHAWLYAWPCKPNGFFFFLSTRDACMFRVWVLVVSRYCMYVSGMWLSVCVTGLGHCTD
jgi:hypothetical protein